MTVDDREIPAWIVDSTDEELDKYIFATSHNEPRHRVGLAERQKRHFKRMADAAEPHWTVLPSFKILKWTLIFTVSVLIVALATLAVAVLSWLHPIEKTQQIPADKSAISATSFVSKQTNSPIAKQPAQSLQSIVK
jgi:hypothetical protein